MELEPLMPGRTAVLERSPIAATLERTTAAFEYLDAHHGPLPAGWRPAGEVVNDPAAVRELLDAVCRVYEMDDRQVAASFLVLGYFWQLMSAVLACYLLERRVPDLAANAVAVDLQMGTVFQSRRGWALPDDPDAGHPDLTLVADRAALRRCIVDQLETEHAAPLFATLRMVAPYGIPAMRANYADRLASVILWQAKECGDSDLARVEVPAFVELLDRRARTGLLEVEDAGRSGLFLRRGGCCLNYRLPGREKCDTCCLRPLDERIILLRQHLATDN